MESIEIARLCAKYADEKKAENILLLDLRGLSPVTDFFVVVTASSNPQLRAVRDNIVDELRDKHEQRPIISDGTYESQWLILNYPNVLVHVLSPEKREYYALEELWGDAPKLDWKDTEPVGAPVPRVKKPKVKKAAVKKAPAAKKAPAKKAAKKAATKKVAKKKAE
ncbi:ribosome-associated protein [Prosthecobacter fusiformis]|uniref:Ribosomal silencing factor RsfS n=1 Tax=Prosthecobacter fusiformis TaxID=48464 RepID=A0A4V3FEN0_9BACT|nr:ribosome silencing factor [Prosthecobacter fusiformis]TDU66613.1 ribosome-associated protein [Prosthecobacter fusiformis]